MSPEKSISIVIPNCNMSATIEKCLESAFRSGYGNFEVIVVDDKSSDASPDIIERFPCKLIRLDKHSGAAQARNIGARQCSGEVIFFTDADCLIREDTLSVINRTLSVTGSDVIIGGTYTKIPYDKRFFSMFQSAFVHYSETKKLQNPDYVAAHAMVVRAEIFRQGTGFPTNFLPILEDVEFSHRLRRNGYELVVNPDIQVQHIFNFSFVKSVRNAIRKSRYWARYSLRNRDFFVDSGTASVELKVNVISLLAVISSLGAWLLMQKPPFLYPLPLIFGCNLFISRGLVRTFRETNGPLFAGLASLYYVTVYALAVGTGTLAGTMDHLLEKAGNK